MAVTHFELANNGIDLFVCRCSWGFDHNTKGAKVIVASRDWIAELV